MSKPSFNKPSVDMKKFRDFKVRISQIPPMDVAFKSMAISDYELLVATIYKLNELITQTNSYTELINEILEWVLNEGLEEAVLEQLTLWLNDGTLETLINETLFNMKLDKTEFEEYKLTVNQVLQDLEQNIQSILDNEIDDLKNLVSEHGVEINEIKNHYTVLHSNMTTDEIQEIIDNSVVKMFMWLDGVYRVDPLFIRSNQTHYFRNNVTLWANDGFVAGDELLSVNGAENVNIFFNGATLKMNSETTTTSGGNIHGFTIRGSKNVIFKDLIVRDSGGDGVYIGHRLDNTPSENISGENITCINHKRQGISITDVRKCYLNNILIDTVYGGDPQAGIDIEPNNPNDFIEDIVIENVVIKNTANAGVIIALPRLAENPSKYNEVSISLRNFHIENAHSGILFFDLYEKLGGFVNIENFTIKNVKQQGILFNGWYKDESPKLYINNITITNVNGDGYSTAYHSSAIVIYNSVDRKSKDIGGFVIENLSIYDTRDIKKMLYSIFARNYLGNTYLTLKNNRVIENGVNGVLFTGNLNYLSPINAIEKEINISSSIKFDGELPHTIYKTLEPRTVYIVNGGVVGNEITFENRSGGVLEVRGNETYTLDNLTYESGVLVEKYVSTSKGSSMRVKMVDVNKFVVLNKTGDWVIE